jgi:hypothetical protein
VLGARGHRIEQPIRRVNLGYLVDGHRQASQ